MAKGKYKKKRERKIIRTTQIQDLGLSNRVVNILSRKQIFALSDLMNYSRAQLMDIPGIGKSTIDEIADKMEAFHIFWE